MVKREEQFPAESFLLFPKLTRTLDWNLILNQ